MPQFNMAYMLSFFVCCSTAFFHPLTKISFIVFCTSPKGGMGTSVSDSGFFRMPLKAAAIRLCERVMLCMVAGVDGEGEGL